MVCMYIYIYCQLSVGFLCISGHLQQACQIIESCCIPYTWFELPWHRSMGLILLYNFLKLGAWMSMNRCDHRWIILQPGGQNAEIDAATVNNPNAMLSSSADLQCIPQKLRQCLCVCMVTTIPVLNQGTFLCQASCLLLPTGCSLPFFRRISLHCVYTAPSHA